MSSTLHKLSQILDDSANYISEKGLQNLSLRSLADGIGSSARMLVHYFGSSENLFDLVLEKFAEAEKKRATEFVEKALKSGNPLETFLKIYVEYYSKYKHSGIVNTIFQMYGSSILGDDKMSRHLRDLHRHWSAEIEKLLERDFKGNGENATLVFAFANGLIFDLLALREPKRIEETIERFVKLKKNQKGKKK